MNPNDNQSTNSVDYLNQIAPQPSKKIDLFRKKPIMIGGIAIGVLVVFVLFGAISSVLSSGTTSLKTLAARLDSTESTVSLAANNLKSTKLRALNSNLKIYLTNTIRDLTPILAAKNIEFKNIDKQILAGESNTKMLATLEDARLNAIYDRIYANEMATQLDKVVLLMRQINGSTNDKDLKDFLNSAYKNLEPTQKQFSEYNAANS